MSLGPDTDRIRYIETDLSDLDGRPVHFICGIYLICVRGRCEVTTGAEDFLLTDETELIYLSGTILQRLSASPDFLARMVLFPKEAFLKAMLPIDTPYLNYADAHPCYRHTPDVRSRMTWRQVRVWMDLAKSMFSGDVRTQFRELLEFDWLQGFLIWLFSTVPEKIEVEPQSTRQQQICCQAADFGTGDLGSGQRRGYNSRLRRAIKAGDHDLFGDADPQVLQSSHHVQRQEVIGADQGIWQVRHTLDLALQPLGIPVKRTVTVQNAVRWIDWRSRRLHGSTKTLPAFVEAAAVMNVPHESNTLCPR